MVTRDIYANLIDNTFTRPIEFRSGRFYYAHKRGDHVDQQERVERMDADITEVKVALARVETSSARTEDAVHHLNDKFDQLIERLTEHFPSRAEVAESAKVVETRLGTVESEVRELRSRSGRLPAWGQAVFTILVGVVSAILGGVYHV